MTGGLLTKRALVLAKVEATAGVDAAPDPINDAILVAEPDYTTDPQVLERNFVSNDLSKFEHTIGRVVAGFTFKVDLRGNDLQHSGQLADMPKLARLFRGCGFELSATDGSGAQNLSQVIADKLNAATTVMSWAGGGAVSVLSPVLYTIEVVTAGASGVAEVIVTGNNDAEDDLSAAAPEVITTGAAVNLGAKGGTITPTFVGSLALGDRWQVLAFPLGVKAKPRSTGHETLTIWMYLDGLLHKGQAAMGNFSIDAEAGNTGMVTFNFTATFEKALDVPMPLNPVYETNLPPQIELSLLSWGGNVDMKADKWSMETANQIEARMDVNAPQGYIGSRISDRAPVGGFTPEVQLEADEPFWNDFLTGRAKTFTVRAGTVPGNQIVIFAPNAQTSGQPYQDRNGLRVYDKSVAFKRGLTGDDEIVFMFC